jgi:mannosyltransferase OCH1-like enzyme
MYPPILHQTWKSKTELPKKFRHWRESFPALNPGFDCRLYDDADNRALLERTFPQLLPLYDGFPQEIFRVDFIRAVYLFTEGGFYADLDFQCLAPLERLPTESHDVILGRMGTDPGFRHAIPNAFMASAAGEGFWLGYLMAMEDAHKTTRDLPNIDKRPEYVVGPVVLRRVAMAYLRSRDAFRQATLAFVRRHGFALDPDAVPFGALALLPGHQLYPINWKDRIHRQFLGRMNREENWMSIEEARRYFPSSIAVTYWANSWQS